MTDKNGEGECYVVEFDTNRPLGMSLEPVFGSCNSSQNDMAGVGCRVKKIDNDEDDHHRTKGGRVQRSDGTCEARNSGRVHVGDVVAAVDGRNVLSHSFDDIVALLKKSRTGRRGGGGVTHVTFRGNVAAGAAASALIDLGRGAGAASSSSSSMSTSDPRPASSASGMPAAAAAATASSESDADPVVKSGPPKSLTVVKVTYRYLRRRCTVPGCENQFVSKGRCISHGAQRKICSSPGCDKRVKRFGLCSACGPARKRCEMDGCAKVAVRGGLCVAHGAGRRPCNVGGCDKWGIVRGMCRRHHREASSSSTSLLPPTGSAFRGSRATTATARVFSVETSMGVATSADAGPNADTYPHCHPISERGETQPSRLPVLPMRDSSRVMIPIVETLAQRKRGRSPSDNEGAMGGVRDQGGKRMKEGSTASSEALSSLPSLPSPDAIDEHLRYHRPKTRRPSSDVRPTAATAVPPMPNFTRSNCICAVCGKNGWNQPICHFVGDRTSGGGRGARSCIDGVASLSRDVSIHAYCGVMAKLEPILRPEYELWSVDAIERNFGRLPGFRDAMVKTRQARATINSGVGLNDAAGWYCLLAEFHENLQQTLAAIKKAMASGDPQST